MILNYVLAAILAGQPTAAAPEVQPTYAPIIVQAPSVPVASLGAFFIFPDALVTAQPAATVSYALVLASNNTVAVPSLSPGGTWYAVGSPGTSLKIRVTATNSQGTTVAYGAAFALEDLPSIRLQAFVGAAVESGAGPWTYTMGPSSGPPFYAEAYNSTSGLSASAPYWAVGTTVPNVPAENYGLAFGVSGANTTGTTGGPGGLGTGFFVIQYAAGKWQSSSGSGYVQTIVSEQTAIAGDRLRIRAEGLTEYAEVARASAPGVWIVLGRRSRSAITLYPRIYAQDASVSQALTLAALPYQYVDEDAGLAASSMRLGVNVPASPNYYQGYGVFVDLMRQAKPSYAPATYTEDADGYPLLPSSASVSFTILSDSRQSDELRQTVPGHYVLLIPGGLTASLAGAMVQNVTTVSPGRIEFDLAAPTVATEPFPGTDGAWLVGDYLALTLTNSTGAAAYARPVVYRSTHESTYQAGKLYTPEFIAACKSWSNGRIRTLDLWSPMTIWAENISEIPRRRRIGIQAGLYTSERYAATWSGTAWVPDGVASNPSYPSRKVAHTDMQFISPEELGLLAVEADRELWVNDLPMFTQAVATEFHTRLKSTYPAGKNIALEVCNEPWNFTSIFSSYMRWNYGLTSEGTGVGAVDTDNTHAEYQLTNHGRHSHRMFEVHDAVWGRSRVTRMHNAQLYYDWTRRSLEVTDTSGATLAAKVDKISFAAYWGVLKDETGADRNWRTEITTQYNARASAYWVAQAKVDIDRVIASVRDWNRESMAGVVQKRLTAVYEFLDHTNLDIRATWASGTFPGQCLTVSGGNATPGNATLSGVSYTHAGEALSLVWSDGDIAFLVAADASLPTTPGSSRAFFVRVKPGGLVLYATRAQYTADTPVTLANGSLLLANMGRLHAVWTQYQDAIRATPDVLAYAVLKLRAIGITDACLFTVNGSYITMPERQAIAAPWALNKGGMLATKNAMQTFATAFPG